ncbi:MAG: alpha/beta fold hydrolase [Elusimicrobia bacterium]|nr:alpha/beta fold hydrolase [Candidatus Liberimonas magnetica]
MQNGKLMSLFLSKLWMLVAIIAGTYLVITMAFFVIQEHLVFFPSRELVSTPNYIKLDFEKIEFKTSDGETINAWFIPKQGSARVILMCHGNAGNISHRLDRIQNFNHMGLNVLVFDYRGYGKSSGKPGEEGTYRDALASWEYLINEKHFQPQDIIIYGESLGGAVAAWLAQDRPAAALILESAFTSIDELGQELYPLLPVKLLARIHYPTRKYLEQVRCPLLVIHSTEDDIVPFSHGQNIFITGNEPKTFLEIHGSHNEGFMVSAGLYEQGIESFVKSIASPSGTGNTSPSF